MKDVAHRIVCLVLISLFLCQIDARVSVAPDGTLYLGSSTPGASVKFEGDLVINGQSITSELASIDNDLKVADQLNFFRLSALRWQRFNIQSPRGAAAFQINGVGYLALANAASTTQQIYVWDSDLQSYSPFQTLTVNGATGNNDFEFVNYLDPPNHYLFLLDAPIGAQPKMYTWNATGNGKFDAGVATKASSVPTGGTQWKYWDNSPNYGSPYLTLVHPSGCRMYQVKTTLGALDIDLIGTGDACTDSTMIPRLDKPAGTWTWVLSTSTGMRSRTFFGNLLTSPTAFGSPPSPAVTGFAANGQYYLVSGEQVLVNGVNVSYIYQLDKSSDTWISTPISNFPTGDAKAFKTWTYNNDLYLFAAFQKTSTTNLSPQLLKWNKYLKRFDSVAFVGSALLNNYNWEVFTPDGKSSFAYLSTDTTSYLYKLTNNL